MKKSTLIFFFLSALIFCLFNSAAAQEVVRLTGEGGIYGAQNDLDDSPPNVVIRMAGLLKFQKNTGRNRLGISMQFKPEFYNSPTAQNALKFISRGNYIQRRAKVQLGLGYDARKYFYSSSSDRLIMDLFQLEGNLTWPFARKFNLSLSPSYYYRDFSNASSQKLDSFVNQLEVKKLFFNKLYVGTGVHVERFDVTSDRYAAPGNTSQTDKGWRIGPKFSCDYQGKVFFNFQYSQLHSLLSDQDFRSTEHYIRLFGSRLLHSQWVMLILIDYYWNDVSPGADTSHIIIFIPFDNENRIDFKLEHLYNQNVIYFMKFGWFKNDLLSREFALKGWQFLAGVEYSR